MICVVFLLIIDVSSNRPKVIMGEDIRRRVVSSFRNAIDFEQNNNDIVRTFSYDENLARISVPDCFKEVPTLVSTAFKSLYISGSIPQILGWSSLSCCQLYSRMQNVHGLLETRVF